MITGINESKILTKHLSCKCECKFDGRKCGLNQKWNKNKCWYECKNPEEHNSCEKDYICSSVMCSCENGKFVGSIIDNLVIMCDEMIKKTKSTATKSTSAKAAPRKNNSINFYILLVFYILLIAVSIYCYLLNYRTKEKHLLIYHLINNELKTHLY